MIKVFFAAAAALLAATAAPAQRVPVEYPIPWAPPGEAGRPPPCGHHGDGCLDPAAQSGSTHEIVYDVRRGEFWISGQNWDSLARVRPDGTMRLQLTPARSGPHGLDFDRNGHLWVTLEFLGRIREINPDTGATLREHDVRLHCRGCAQPLNTRPHGLALGPDGNIWFTGKATGTIGRLSPGGRVAHFQLPTIGSVPIYIRAGPDGNMWVTELLGNAVARVTPAGVVTEFRIPTPNSRPIAIVPGPDGAMWFTEEAGSKVGRIDRDGNMVEFPVPRPQPNAILAGLAFDGDGNLWVQQYADLNNPLPGPQPRDHLIRIDAAALAAGPDALTPSSFAFHPVPTRQTVMHRIIFADGALWFTEMHADRVGLLSLRR
ncbi:MAG: virginiamycin lyase [Sphingomonadales bacterium]|jgi:virginiamycin B lyase|nr:virginiamycin lyase [Sphingomonadales bacterium]